jgi:hypothetical protein
MISSTFEKCAAMTRAFSASVSVCDHADFVKALNEQQDRVLPKALPRGQS